MAEPVFNRREGSGLDWATKQRFELKPARERVHFQAKTVKTKPWLGRDTAELPKSLRE